MSKKITFTIGIFLTAATMTWAQQKDSAKDSLQLEQVVVTASKVPIPLKNSAKPVSIISRQEIEKSSGKSVGQLLNEQTGIVINGFGGNPGINKGLYVRGASSAYTLILIDGMAVNDPSSGGGAFDIRNFPMEQIERIEIVKGSQSTLYGSDAIAGVINIITRKGGVKPLNVSGLASYGSNNTRKGTASVYGSNEQVDYNFSYQYNQTDGISEASSLDPSAKLDNDGYKREGVQANLGFQLAPQLKVMPYFRFTDFNSSYDGGSFVDAENEYASRFTNTGVAVKADLKKLDIKGMYGWTAVKREYKTAFGNSAFEGNFQNAELYLNYDFNAHIEVLAGLNYQRQQMLGAATIKDPYIEIASPYLTFLLKNVKGINLELGYRHNRHSKFGNTDNFSVAPAYWITEKHKVYGLYSTGFKAPTISELYGLYGANPDLSPQKSTTWEAGVQSFWANNAITTQLSYFNRKIDEIIHYDFSIGYFNQDKQNDEGVEAEMSWKINKMFNLKAQYAFVTGEINTTNTAGSDTTFYNLVRRPKHRAALTLGIQPINNLYISLNGQYNGKRVDYFYNPANNFAAEEVGLDSFVLLNAYIEYQFVDKHFTLFADMKNLTDAQFIETYGYGSMGFTTQAGLKLKF